MNLTFAESPVSLSSEERLDYNTHLPLERSHIYIYLCESAQQESPQSLSCCGPLL